MRVEIIVCDRCDQRIRKGETRVDVRTRAGDNASRRELCGICGELLRKFLKGAPLADLERELAAITSHEPDRALRDARTIANGALERWADGATADELADRLRDITSAAHRTAA